ncbi:MAG: HlyC/CorC family transporter [Bacteroidetes bacterium]|nr:HlyC/CorC family transporter [Bacteroidota bacterium]
MPDPVVTSLLLLAQNPDMSTNWVVVFTCLVTGGFFAGMEIAFLSANKLRIELRSKQGSFTAKVLSRYLKTPSDFISTVLVANNLALVIYGIYMSEILDAGLKDYITNHFIKFSLITVLSTVIVLVTAEYLPKSLFRINPDTVLFSLALPFRLVHIVLWPLIFFSKKISGLLLRLFTNAKVTENTVVFSKVDLDNYIVSLENTGQAETTDIDTEVFRNALEFSDVRVRDFMVPRTELIAVDIQDSVEELHKLFIETALSKILIYRDNIDHIIGFVHQSEMFGRPSRIQDVLKPVLIVNESMQAHDLLRDFIQKRKSIAVVVDEFGGTAGLVVIEDVIEEIFGEIDDEFDTEQLTETEVAPGHYIFSTRHEVEYLNEKYNLVFPEGDYNTLGGFIISISGKIPRVRESIREGTFEFIITKTKGSKIEEVELFIRNEEA